MTRLFLLFLALSLGNLSAETIPPVRTVFVIVLENHTWALIKGNTNMPYLNNAILPIASHCEQYYNPPAIHPSEPNYLWLEAGTNFGIFDDNPPSINSQNTTNHLVTLLKNANISWKTYQEGIDGTHLPLTIISTNYDPKHCAFLFFDDVTGTNDPNNAYGLAHVRPFTELAGDLASNTVARYNFLTPDLCDDGHNCTLDVVDGWLSQQIPMIMSSAAYTNNGAIFITWDEGQNSIDGPIGMIVLSPLAKGNGYYNNIHYDHGSTLRTFQEIFNVMPFLNAAANVTDLSDLFGTLQTMDNPGVVEGNFQMTVAGLTPGVPMIVQSSTDLMTWAPILTNFPLGNSFLFIDSNSPSPSVSHQFYRLQLPQSRPPPQQ